MSEKIKTFNRLRPSDSKDEDLFPGDYCFVTKEGFEFIDQMWIKYVKDDGTIVTTQFSGTQPTNTTFNLNDKLIDFGQIDFSLMTKLNTLHNESAKMGYKQALIDMKVVIDSMLEKFK